MYVYVQTNINKKLVVFTILWNPETPPPSPIESLPTPVFFWWGNFGLGFVHVQDKGAIWKKILFPWTRGTCITLKEAAFNHQIVEPKTRDCSSVMCRAQEGACVSTASSSSIISNDWRHLQWDRKQNLTKRCDEAAWVSNNLNFEAVAPAMTAVTLVSNGWSHQPHLPTFNFMGLWNPNRWLYWKNCPTLCVRNSVPSADELAEQLPLWLWNWQQCRWPDIGHTLDIRAIHPSN